jgi:8-oxo-dGTP diphosphatase
VPGDDGPEVSVPGESPTPPGTGAAAPARRVPCAGAVIKDDVGRILLILRGHDPGKGLWSIPGGRIEPGETGEEAVVREVREETGLEATCGQLLGSVERPGHNDDVIVIADYIAIVVGGELAAADDAADAAWVTPDRLVALDATGELTPGLLTALRSWGQI